MMGLALAVGARSLFCRLVAIIFVARPFDISADLAPDLRCAVAVTIIMVGVAVVVRSVVTMFFAVTLRRPVLIAVSRTIVADLVTLATLWSALSMTGLAIARCSVCVPLWITDTFACRRSGAGGSTCGLLSSPEAVEVALFVVSVMILQHTLRVGINSSLVFQNSKKIIRTPDEMHSTG